MRAWDIFKKNNESFRLVASGDRVLAAVSGGPDSVAMLHLLLRLKKTLRFELFVVCMDHGLRKTAKSETTFVKKISDKLKLKCFVINIPVKEYAKKHKVSMETAARNLRYETLRVISEENGVNKIATGHNSNDNAETVIMWLIRGSGPDGLAGIPMQRPLDRGLIIIRPILPVSRDQIIAYLKSQKMTYKVDESNFSLDYTRNKIRHTILPLFKNINPESVSHIYNMSRLIGAQNDCISSIAERQKKRSVIVKSGRIELDLQGFIGYNRTIQTQIIKSILPEKRSLAQIERILSWMLAGPSKALVFSRSWRLRKNKNKLIFQRIS